MAVEKDVTIFDTAFSNDSTELSYRGCCMGKSASQYSHIGYEGILVTTREAQPDEYNASRVRSIEECRWLTVCAISARPRDGAGAVRFVCNAMCGNFGVCGGERALTSVIRSWKRDIWMDYR